MASRSEALIPAVISTVDLCSSAARAGLAPGDRILLVDGEPVRDLIDWRWHTADTSIQLEVMTGGATRTLLLERDDKGFGISFDELIFDQVKICENACEFCFISQSPAGLRPSLYIRDDDYRLSFLVGNFITLTNLTKQDVDRILTMRLSPLYVSLHAVDPEVRRRLICAIGDDRAVDTLDGLLEAGIQAHVQIVLVPDVNDGAVLEQTLDWLEQRGGVLSVGVVPLGYTAHQSRYETSFDVDGSREVVSVIEERRARRAAEGRTLLFHAADELYLRAGMDLPVFDAYENFPQYENGIGLVRSFVHEWELTLDTLHRDDRDDLQSGCATLVTGELFAPVLERLVSDTMIRCHSVRVLTVRNTFFGGGVTVAGLLTGKDLMATIRDDMGTRPYFVPDVVLNTDGVTIDDLTAEEIRTGADADVRFVSSNARDLIETLAAIGPEE